MFWIGAAPTVPGMPLRFSMPCQSAATTVSTSRSPDHAGAGTHPKLVALLMQSNFIERHLQRQAGVVAAQQQVAATPSSSSGQCRSRAILNSHRSAARLSTVAKWRLVAGSARVLSGVRSTCSTMSTLHPATRCRIFPPQPPHLTTFSILTGPWLASRVVLIDVNRSCASFSPGRIDCCASVA